MAERRRGGCFLLFLAVMIFSTFICCCGCAGLFQALPELFLEALTVQDPLVVPQVDPAPDLKADLARRFGTDEPVYLSGEELVQLVDPGHSPNVKAFWIDFDAADHILVDVSWRVPETASFVNVHAAAQVRLEHGWFTLLRFDALRVGAWDIGQHIAGREMASDANRSLADQRSKDSDMAVVLDQVESLYVQDGRLRVDLVEGGWERIAQVME